MSPTANSAVVSAAVPDTSSSTTVPAGDASTKFFQLTVAESCASDSKHCTNFRNSWACL